MKDLPHCGIMTTCVSKFAIQSSQQSRAIEGKAEMEGIMNKISVFVSYSWDSDEHKARVQSLVEQLRRDGFEVYTDQNMSLGEEITRFMEAGIVKCDRVLMICTPKYKRKADERKGGVGYESRICTSEVYQNNEPKFIPILFEGTISGSFPVWIKGNLGVDLSDGNFMGPEYQRLVSDLKRNSYLTAADRITDGQIAYDTRAKDKIVSIILSFFLCVFFFLLLPVFIHNYKFNIVLTLAGFLTAIASLGTFWICSLKKKPWLAKLQSMLVFGLSFWGAIFSYTTIEIPQPFITPGNVGVIRERPETIKISAEDGLEIYYTTDGSDPKELEEPGNVSDMANFVTCTLDKSTVVSARAKFLFFWSDVTERTYTFVKPPITDEESTGAGAFYSERDIGNGGEFLLHNSGYLFRKYNSDSFEDGLFGFWDNRDGRSKKISFLYSDGTVEELFDDAGYGPLYFARGNLYMTQYKGYNSCVYSVDLSDYSTAQYGEGEIIGMDDKMRYLVCKDGQTVYVIDTDSGETAYVIEATGGVMGFYDNNIYFAICAETGEKEYEKEYILQIRKWSFENLQEAVLTSFIYTASSMDSAPEIEKAQFSGEDVYFTYGTMGGSMAYYTGCIARLNLHTYEMERIVENLCDSDFLVTNVSGEPYLYYYGDAEECIRINVDSRIVDYPSAETLTERDIFEDEDGLCFYDKNNTKQVLINAADYEAYGYQKGQLGQSIDGQYFAISEINEFPDKIFFRVDIGYHDTEQDVGWRPWFVRLKTQYYYKELYTGNNVLIYEI